MRAELDVEMFARLSVELELDDNGSSFGTEAVEREGNGTGSVLGEGKAIGTEFREFEFAADWAGELELVAFFD